MFSLEQEQSPMLQEIRGNFWNRTFSIIKVLGLEEGSISFYKCSGIMSIVLQEITNYDHSDFQIYVNQLGYDTIHETAINCVIAVENKEKSWNFLLNSKSNLRML